MPVKQICIDARYMGNDIRFIRKCCSPNAEIQNCSNNKKLRFFVVAKREIQEDEEITIEFDFKWQKAEFDVECSCKQLRQCEVAKFYKNRRKQEREKKEKEEVDTQNRLKETSEKPDKEEKPKFEDNSDDDGPKTRSNRPKPMGKNRGRKRRKDKFEEEGEALLEELGLQNQFAEFEQFVLKHRKENPPEIPDLPKELVNVPKKYLLLARPKVELFPKIERVEDDIELKFHGFNDCIEIPELNYREDDFANVKKGVKLKSLWIEQCKKDFGGRLPEPNLSLPIQSIEIEEKQEVPLENSEKTEEETDQPMKKLSFKDYIKLKQT